MTSAVGDEVEIGAAWLDTVLTGDTELASANPGGVWDGPAKPGTPYPLTKIELMSAITVRGVSFTEIMVNSLWLVTSVFDGASYAPLRAGAVRIQSLLHGKANIAVTGGMIVTAAREQPFRQEAVQGGKQFKHYGGLYRIYIQGT